MADTNDNNGGLYFIVGGLVVAAVAFGFYYFSGNAGNNNTSTHTASIIERVTPAAGEAPSAPDVDIDVNKKDQ